MESWGLGMGREAPMFRILATIGKIKLVLYLVVLLFVIFFITRLI